MSSVDKEKLIRNIVSMAMWNLKKTEAELEPIVRYAVNHIDGEHMLNTQYIGTCCTVFAKVAAGGPINGGDNVIISGGEKPTVYRIKDFYKG